MRLVSLLLPIVVICNCSGPESSPPSVATKASLAEPAQCFRAREPCTMSAWELDTPTGKVLAVVRGPGSPTPLPRAVLLAGNDFEVCGVMTKPIDDVECGEMPVLTAERFRVRAPVKQFVDCDLDGLAEDCWRDGKPILEEHASLVEARYEGVRLVRIGDDYRFTSE